MKKTISNYDIKSKKVIIRCDFNVPIKDGIIIDDTRIKESLKTIQYAIDQDAKIILLSHLGRIKEQADLAKNSLQPIAKRLSELLHHPVPKTRGVEDIISSMKEKDIVLLENTRYEDLNDKKESSNDQELGKYWASLGDIFINDAFGTIHRSHASNVGIASHLPNGIGFLVEKELQALSILNQPERPYMVILGGAKVSDKIGVIQNLIVKADKILIGGAMAFTFLKAKNLEIGKSLVEDEYLSFCKEIMNQYPNKIILPEDIVVAKEKEEESPTKNKEKDQLDPDDIGLDLGFKTIEMMKEILKDAKTVVWNGPLGYYEIPKYQNSTKELLEFLTNSSKKIILGGGDIVALCEQLGFKQKVTHASTGGATLEYLEGKKLPGLEIIENQE